MRDYFWNLWLWARGIRWLWSKRVDFRYEDGTPPFSSRYGYTIAYQDGWGPVSFLLPYLTTYLWGTIAGYGVVSLSRAWHDRQSISPFAKFMTRALDWIFPGKHGVNTGPRLWGSVCLRKMP